MAVWLYVNHKGARMAATPDNLLDLLGEMVWWWTGFLRQLSRLEESGGDTVCRFGERLEAMGVVPARAPREVHESLERTPSSPVASPVLHVESLKRYADGSIGIVCPGMSGKTKGGRAKPLRLERRLAALFLVLLDEAGGATPGSALFRTKQELARLITARHGTGLLASRNGRPEDLVVKYLSKLRRELIIKARADVIQSARGRGYRLLVRRTATLSDR
jgi:hypothetical protein